MRYRSLRRVEGDVNEFVSRSDAKAHLRVDFTDDDALITSLIVAARRWAEDYCDTTFILSNYTMYLDSFYGPIGSPIQFGLRADGSNIEGRQGTVPNLDVELPRPPLSQYDDTGSTSAPVVYYKPSQNSDYTVLSTSLYRVDYSATPGVLRPLYGQTWPAHLVDQNSVKIVWWAGYNPSAEVNNYTFNEDVLRSAVLMLVAHLYRNREMTTQQALSEVPMGTKALLDTLRWGSYR